MIRGMQSQWLKISKMPPNLAQCQIGRGKPTWAAKTIKKGARGQANIWM